VPIDYAPDTAWPPPEVAAASPFYREWLAWYSGDGEALHNVYAGYNRVPAPHVRPSQLNGGASGWLSRMWWGNPVYGTAARRLHVPAASDISMISSDLIFSEPPAFTLTQGNQQDAFEDLLLASQILSTLAEAAEKGSAAGGVYLRASINRTVAPVPIAEALFPDNAIPDFYGPFLRSVTFWRVVGTIDGGKARHLEHHYMDPRRGCLVEHALFVGGDSVLGRRVPLTDGDEECKRLATLIDSAGVIETKTSVLDVVYVPNVRPHRMLRGTMLGRSDYAGAESTMDALDETMSAWMRALRLAKARLMVPREYLRRPGAAGQGTAFDPEQEIFQAINAAIPSDGTLSITPVQFSVDVAQYRDTVAAHWRTITSCAGLDTSDHDTDNGPMMTATQVNDKGSRKRATRGKKIKYWTPNLQQLLICMQELAGMTPSPVEIEWPDAAAPDIQTMAQTLQLLEAAVAVSTQTKVEMLHPDWKEEEVRAEVARITAQTSAAAPQDPGSFTGDTGDAPDPQPVGDPVDEEPVTDAGQP
jgi:hypothetical protein